MRSTIFLPEKFRKTELWEFSRRKEAVEIEDNKKELQIPELSEEETYQLLLKGHFDAYMEEMKPLYYVLRFVFLGLLTLAGYRFLTDGDWIQPLLCFAGLVVWGVVLWILANLRRF